MIIFTTNVTHGFIATTGALMYEQQTSIRQDFLDSGFIEKLSNCLKKSDVKTVNVPSNE